MSTTEEDNPSAAERLEAQAFEALRGLSVDEILREGHKQLILQLATRCRAGTATHQEMAIFRNILRDNGLTLGLPPEQPPNYVAPSPMELPVLEDPDYDRRH